MSELKPSRVRLGLNSVLFVSGILALVLTLVIFFWGYQDSHLFNENGAWVIFRQVPLAQLLAA